MMQNPWKMNETWHMGIYLKVLSKTFSMNINLTGLKKIQKPLRPCALDESSLSIGRVNNDDFYGLRLAYVFWKYRQSRVIVAQNPINDDQR